MYLFVCPSLSLSSVCFSHYWWPPPTGALYPLSFCAPLKFIDITWKFDWLEGTKSALNISRKFKTLLTLHHSHFKIVSLASDKWKKKTKRFYPPVYYILRYRLSTNKCFHKMSSIFFFFSFFHTNDRKKCINTRV